MAKAPSAIVRLDPWVHGPAVTRLFADAFGNDNAPAGSRSDTTVPSAWAIDDDAVGLVWLESGQVCGVVTALPSSWMPDAWTIANLVTHPNVRRRGIARALLIELMRICVSQGTASFQLQVDSANSSAISLYRHLGFKLVGEIITAKASAKTPITPGTSHQARRATPKDMQAVDELLHLIHGQEVWNHAQWQTAIKASTQSKALNNTSRQVYVANSVNSAAVLVTMEQVGTDEIVLVHPAIDQSMPASEATSFIRSVLSQLALSASAYVEFQTTASDLVCQMALSKLACTTIRRLQHFRRLGRD